ncbi:MAG: calcium-binding protein [Micrococcales bacterium]|nr:calcium-binding protein [Actinomycetota bacterium]NCA07460.1 calcium-binding protein [Micrococcales bacterium]
MSIRSFTSLAMVALFITSFPNVSSAGTADANCTIYGTAKSDQIFGTAGNDIICAGSGNDTISGLGGNDIIYGGPGNDGISGGSGNDQIFGEAGNDYVEGGAGKDQLSGDSGNDNLNGGAESDLIRGNAGTDFINGGTGNDLIDGGLAKDTIRTGVGNDSCSSDSSDVMLDSCRLDKTAPELGVNTTDVKTFAAGSTIKLSWSVSDVSGVERTWGNLGGPPGWITTWCGFGIDAQLISGDSKSGVYQLECKVPENAVNETYTLFIGAYDVLGNSTSTMPQMSFTITGGSSDAKAPEFTDITLDSAAKPGGEFTLTVTASDATGIAGIYGWFMKDGGGFASYPDIGPYVDAITAADLITGTNQAGTYRQIHRFSNKAPAGTYTLWLSLYDVVGNKIFLQTDKKISVTN